MDPKNSVFYGMVKEIKRQRAKAKEKNKSCCRFKILGVPLHCVAGQAIGFICHCEEV
jgi:hypothetical protein